MLYNNTHSSGDDGAFRPPHHVLFIGNDWGLRRGDDWLTDAESESFDTDISVSDAHLSPLTSTTDPTDPHSHVSTSSLHHFITSSLHHFITSSHVAACVTPIPLLLNTSIPLPLPPLFCSRDSFSHSHLPIMPAEALLFHEALPPVSASSASTAPPPYTGWLKGRA